LRLAVKNICIHDRFSGFSKEMADAYVVTCQQKTERAVAAGKMKDMIIPIEVELADGSKIIADRDQQPRPGTTMEGLTGLKTPFREEGGRVTAGNASGLNDGAAAVLMMSRSKADELGLQPKMRWVASAVAGVDSTIMGIAPVPATEKALKKAGLTIDDIVQRA
jgi:acetyl-CoA acyltransferase